MAALLRLFRLGSQSLWIDEVLTWRSAYIGRPIGLPEVLENVHGPFYSLVLHLWGGVFGESEWALRLPSALAGIALVPATAWVAGRWLGAATAVPAAWLAAGSPFLIWYAQEARNYSMLMLWAVLAAAALLGMRDRLSAAGVAGWLGATAAGTLSNFSFTLLAPLHAAWWLGAPGRRGRRLLVALAAAAALALVLLPWVPRLGSIWDWTRLRPARAIAAAEPRLRTEATFHPAAVPFALHAFAVGYGLGPPVRELRREPVLRALRPHVPALAATALVFGALGVLGARAVWRRKRALEAALWIVAPLLLLCYLALHNFKVFHPRYVAVAVPGVLIVLAAGLADLGGRARAAFAVAIGALWAVSLAHHYGDPRYAKEDIRSAAALIDREGGPGQKIVSVNTGELLLYYYRGPLTVEPFWLGLAADPERMAARFEDLARSPNGTWVVLARPEDLDPAGQFVRHLEHRHPGASRHAFNGVTVWRLPPR